jgi:hypothetical protein
MQVKDLTTEGFKLLIRETVLEVLGKAFEDPDAGRQLRAEVEQQILAMQKRRKSGQRGIAAAEVAARYGMN